jgi:hypothetical protein
MSNDLKHTLTPELNKKETASHKISRVFRSSLDFLRSVAHPFSGKLNEDISVDDILDVNGGELPITTEEGILVAKLVFNQSLGKFEISNDFCRTDHDLTKILARANHPTFLAEVEQKNKLRIEQDQLLVDSKLAEAVKRENVYLN